MKQGNMAQSEEQIKYPDANQAEMEVYELSESSK
jgi:hypothetical protein